MTGNDAHMSNLDWRVKAPIPQDEARAFMHASADGRPLAERVVDAAVFLETNLTPDDLGYFKADYESGLVTDELLVDTAQAVAARFMFGTA